MIHIEVQLDDINYDKIFEVYFRQAKEMLTQSDEPAAGLMARVPDSVARTIWNGLTNEQKEKIAARLLQAKANEYAYEAVKQLHDKSIDLHVKKIDITAK